MYGRIFLGVLGLLGPIVDAAPSSRHSASSVAKRQLPSYLQQDYYAERTWPDTGATVSKTFYVSAQTVSPDGFAREAIVVTEKDPAGGELAEEDITVPGPKIEAKFGDWIEVQVVNRLKDAGTSIHFHGVRQYHSNEMDGTPSITQCPLAPGNSTTYRWRASQYGTSWYHGHFGVQAWDGVFGPIIIHHRESKEADIDLGPIMLSDWTHVHVEERYKEAAGATFGSNVDNILINGQNIPADGDATKGQRHQIVFKEKQTHRLRLINSAADTTFLFSIDNHEMEVIAADFVPIVPYKTKTIQISMGQRYDVLVNADQEAKEYWLRAIPSGQCSGATHANTTNGLGIVRYDAGSKRMPETDAWSPTEEQLKCHDELASNLVPALEKSVPTVDIAESRRVLWSVAMNMTGPEPRFTYMLEVDGKDTQSTFFSDWRFPTLAQYVNNDMTHIQGSHTINIPKNDKWLQVVIVNSGSMAHPIHLHGHDFYVLEQTSTSYNPDNVKLNTKNPPRRDVAVLQPDGYLVLAIEADNPGAWLMHCHVGFHAAEGMNIQITERMDEAVKLVSENGSKDTMSKTCDAWKRFQEKNGLDQLGMWEAGP